MAGSKSGVQLAKLWVSLSDIRDKIDNEAIPLGVHLRIEDPELMQALETLSEIIRNHFGRWHLVAKPSKDNNPRAL